MRLESTNPASPSRIEFSVQLAAALLRCLVLGPKRSHPAGVRSRFLNLSFCNVLPPRCLGTDQRVDQRAVCSAQRRIWSSISQHHESQLRGLRHRFGPTVSIELGEYRSDMKLGGVERNTQATGNRFV